MGRTSDANVRLMHAALDLMWEESYGAVSIDDICKRADVKKGSFYYFFASKAELAVASLELMWEEEWKPNLDRFFSSSLLPLDRFAMYFKSIHVAQVESKIKHGKVLGCPVCSVGCEVSTQEIDVSAKVRELFSRKIRYYESTIRDAVAAGVIEPCDAGQTAVALFGMLDGLITHARVMNDPDILGGLSDMAFNLLRVKTPHVAPGLTTAG